MIKLFHYVRGGIFYLVFQTGPLLCCNVPVLLGLVSMNCMLASLAISYDQVFDLCFMFGVYNLPICHA